MTNLKENKVLVIEDSKSINDLLVQSITSELHIDVASASSFKEARQIIKDFKDEFFVAVVDLNLPDAPNGEVVDFVLENGIPPIILTGSMSDDLHDKMMDKAIIDYVVKRNLNEFEYVLETIERLRNNSKRKILVVDDSKSSRDLITSLLKRHNFSVLQSADGVEAMKTLDEEKEILMIITDYNMPNMDGMELTTKVRETYSRNELSIIGISTAGAGSTSIKLLKSGANDFINRPFMHEEFYCRVNQNIDAIVSYRQLKESANRDFLTNLYNRKYFFSTGEKLFSNAKRDNITLMIAMFDIDYFKNINDTYGHHIGDLAIQHLASILSDNIRDTDIIARFGGEEFCLLSINIDNLSAEKMLEKIRSVIENTPLVVENITVPIKVSIGYTTVLTETIDLMVNDSDSALYQAKESGRNKVVQFHPF